MSQFGNYTLLDRLATGGMAEIYRARYVGAAGVTKPVVIKRILPHYAGDQSFTTMFVNEARIAATLSHGNIAQVFDFGELDGEYFLVMEYVPGQPLSKVLERAKGKGLFALPPPFAVLIAMEICQGLHYAHTRRDEHGRPLNIVHRDVSPQNVIVSYEGQVKLVDFGIAKARNARKGAEAAEAAQGKFNYFAPEQVRGEPLDARTDVFAVGVVLYEMLCGERPFEGKLMKVLEKIAKGEYRRPREVNPDLPSGLEPIVTRALAPEKSARYQSAEALQEALGTYLYTHAPSFAPSSLESLMGYLFEPELAAEGRVVPASGELAEQAALWRQMLPKATNPALPRSTPSLPMPVVSPDAPPRRRPVWVLAAMVAAALLGALVDRLWLR